MPTRTALVTGANRGIGLEIARQLGLAGFQVTGTSRDPEKGEAARLALQEKGVTVSFLALDLQDRQSIATLPDRLPFSGPLDVLVHNAAVMPNSGDSSRVDLVSMDKTLQTNALGPLQLSQVLLPRLKQSADAHIIHLSSEMGAFSSMGSGWAAYRLSKTALNGLTAIMAEDLRPFGIRVFAMCPGWVRTEMGGRSAPRSPAQGAETAVWLATAQEAPSGMFFRDREVIPW